MNLAFARSLIMQSEVGVTCASQSATVTAAACMSTVRYGGKVKDTLLLQSRTGGHLAVLEMSCKDRRHGGTDDMLTVDVDPIELVNDYQQC